MTDKKKRGRPKSAAKMAVVPEPKIDQELKNLIIPLTAEEYAQLERNLLAEGRCRDPLVVWKGQNILLDGHHRLEICKKHSLPYNVVEIELPDREAALAWIRDNQLGRRNLTPEAVSYLRGQHYNNEKKSHGGDRKSEEASGNETHLKTDEILAERYKVAPKTIRNDGDFAEAIDKITKNCDDDFKTAVLHREATLTRSQVKELAEMDPEEQRKEVSKVIQAGKMIKRQADEGVNDAKAGTSDKKEITVPTEPKALAKALLRLLTPSRLILVQKAITKALAEHQAKHSGDQSKEKPKRRRKAATEEE